MGARILAVAAALALSLLPGTLAHRVAFAQELTGTLKRVHDSGAMVIGFRASSIPFSYLDTHGQPIGYSIDLCNEVVDEVSSELGIEVAVKYQKVTAESRIAALVAGEIDIECGSTTSNFERKKQVAFSPVFFVSGTKLLVRRDSGVASYRDLRDKTVVVTAGTTNEVAVKTLSDKQGLGIKFLVGRDHADSFAILASGKADAFATDDILLYGLVATTKSGDDYVVVGDFLSYDPYGLMFRKDDPAFAEVVERTFARLAQDREIVQMYNKWFLKRLPSGERLNLPISPQLEEFFRVLGVPD